MKLKLSTLPKTWIIDIDGTIFIHNGYLSGKDMLVPNFIEFYKNIQAEDLVILITSRNKKYERRTIQALKKNNIRYNKIIFNAPKGERIIINDAKHTGLKTAIAISNKRDKFNKIKVEYIL